MAHRWVNQQMGSVRRVVFAVLAIAMVLVVGTPAAASAFTGARVEEPVAFSQADSVAQAEAQDGLEVAQEEEVTESSDPLLSDRGYIMVALVPVLIAAVVFASRLVGRIDRLSVSRFDAWLKTAVIVAVLVLTTVILPDFLLTLSAVTSLDRWIQDLIGVAAWSGALFFCLWGLWYAHRESRI